MNSMILPLDLGPTIEPARPSRASAPRSASDKDFEDAYNAKGQEPAKPARNDREPSRSPGGEKTADHADTQEAGEDTPQNGASVDQGAKGTADAPPPERSLAPGVNEAADAATQPWNLDSDAAQTSLEPEHTVEVVAQTAPVAKKASMSATETVFAARVSTVSTDRKDAALGTITMQAAEPTVPQAVAAAGPSPTVAATETPGAQSAQTPARQQPAAQGTASLTDQIGLDPAADAARGKAKKARQTAAGDNVAPPETATARPDVNRAAPDPITPRDPSKRLADTPRTERAELAAQPAPSQPQAPTAAPERPAMIVAAAQMATLEKFQQGKPTTAARDADGYIAPLDGGDARPESARALTSASASMNTRADLPVNVARQVMEAMQKTTERSIELQLQPRELGKLRLSLTPAETGMAVAIVAERAETLDLLRRNIQTLEQNFVDLGYTDVSFSFGTGFDGQASQDDRPNAPGVQGLALDLDPQDVAAVPHEPTRKSPPTAVGNTSGLDLRL